MRKTPFDTKICGPFYQDRLGTSIGEALKNRDDAFFAGHTNATLDDCEAAMDKGAFFPDAFLSRLSWQLSRFSDLNNSHFLNKTAKNKTAIIINRFYF